MRIEPLTQPFAPASAELLASMMPAGVEPIGLFRTFAKNHEMTDAMRTWGHYELSRKLSLDLRTREIVINRTCARCECEYEWGVHVAFFAEQAALDRDHIRSLTTGGPHDECWTAPSERAAIELVDALHDTSTVDDDLWARLSEAFSEPQLLDLSLIHI